MNYTRLREVEEAKHKDAFVRERQSVPLFIAGPYINLNEDKNHKDNNNSPAKSLRYALCKHFDAPGSTIYLGEDVELRSAGEKHYGDRSNAVIYERHFIIGHLDAVILLPSSPGSFCEAGDWVTSPKICQKLLVIVDATHKGEISYISEGVVKFALQQGATVKYLDYADHAEVKKICSQFLDDILAKIRIEQLYDRR